MKKYFELQYKMTNRKFKDAGVHPLLAYILLSFLFVALSVYLFNKTAFAPYIYLLFALSVVGNLSESRRSEFLKICFGDVQLKKIRILENLICAIPFVLFLIFKLLFAYAGLLLILTTILALVNVKTAINYTFWTPFSKRPFEFSTGFRNTFFLFFIAYALTIASVAVHNFNLGIFAMLLVFATSLSFYAKPENEYYVWTYNLQPRAFLFSKIKTALSYSSAIALPIALVLGIFNPEQISIIAMFFIIGWGFLICILVNKYAAYPNEMNIVQGIFLALCVWFPPILIVLIPYLFKQSERRLSAFLK